MTVIARFHLDPTVEPCPPCLDEACELDAHHELRVRGVHSVEEFRCEHQVNRVYWHALTPADHPDPVCEHGCEMTSTLIG